MENEEFSETDEENDFVIARRRNIAELEFLYKGLQEAAQDLDHHVQNSERKKNEIKKKISLKRKRPAPRRLKLDWDYEPRKSSRISAIGPIDYKSLVDFSVDDEGNKKKKSFSLKVNLKSRKVSLLKPVEEFVDYTGFDDFLLGDKIEFCGYSRADKNNADGLSEILDEFDKNPKPFEVTATMLKHIQYKSTNKVYDKDYGTSCHQCRQKTVDTKSFCRWPLCRGVRGQFCGFCLKKRYGEELKDVLRNPEWKCPPCRAICNCSICRNRQGKAATGILSHIAEGKGFRSVCHLLKFEEKEAADDESPESNLKSMKKGVNENTRIQLTCNVQRLKTVVAGLEEYGKKQVPIVEEILTVPQQSNKTYPTTGGEFKLKKMELILSRWAHKIHC